MNAGGRLRQKRGGFESRSFNFSYSGIKKIMPVALKKLDAS
jgi:hypothetical protein